MHSCKVVKIILATHLYMNVFFSEFIHWFPFSSLLYCICPRLCNTCHCPLTLYVLVWFFSCANERRCNFLAFILKNTPKVSLPLNVQNLGMRGIGDCRFAHKIAFRCEETAAIEFMSYSRNWAWTNTACVLQNTNVNVKHRLNNDLYLIIPMK